MANTIGKFIKAGKNIFDHLDSKVNFSIPENIVSYMGINGKKDNSNLQLNQNNFRLQIGKMQKNSETIYTEEVLLPAIEYILNKLNKTGENQKVIIQLRPDLARFLTNEDRKEDSKQILSFEEEKQKIIKLIKKYFKNRVKNVEIINVSKQYPELFSLLKEKGKDGLYSAEKPILNKDKDSFSALNIAKYLYRLSQRNPKLMELFYNTKTKTQKEIDQNKMGENQSDYYSLIEVSIRLYEVVSGISIQGGIDRQKEYDKIIGGILQRKDIDSFKIKDYPELLELHNLCLEKNPDFVFERLRISTKDAEKVGEKINKLSKMKKISLISSSALFILLAGFIGGYGISDYNHKKKAKRNVAEKVSQHDINIRFDGSKSWTISDLENKKDYLNNVANTFISAYGQGNISREDIFYMIVDRFDDESFSYQNYGKSKFHKMNFINQKFIPANKVQLQNNGIDLEPYLDLSEYEDAFVNSYLDTTDISIQKGFIDMQFPSSGVTPQEVHKIGEYTTIHGTTYELGYIMRNFEILNKNNNSYGGLYGLNGSAKFKKYIVAKEKQDPYLGFSDEFSVEKGKYLCEDYFIRTRPQLQFAYDIISMICESTKTENGYIADSQTDEIQEILLEYFIKNKIPRDDPSKYQDKTYPKDRMDLIYKKILPDNLEKFKKIGIDPIPYNNFNQFIDAFQNTQEYRNMSNETRGKNDFLLPTYKDLANYDQKYIGNYVTQDGQSYIVYHITVQGKRYIIASEKDTPYYGYEPCMSYGIEVRKDFQKNRLNQSK